MLEKGFRRDELPYAQKLYTPEPRIREGLLISEYASALTDISDSLAVSAHLISKASRVKIVIERDKLDLSYLTEFVGEEKAIELFLYGGGDYELLFTAESSDIGLEIGRVEEGSGVYLDRTIVPFRGYSHF
jgi:thiamine-monophosphate kinase